MNDIAIDWVPVTTTFQLADAFRASDDYLVRITGEIYPLGMFYGMMSGDVPTVWAAVEKNLPVHLAYVKGLNGPSETGSS